MAGSNGSQFQQFDLNLDQPVANIGSHPDNDIVLPGASPFHAVMVREDGQLRLLSLGVDAPVNVDGTLLCDESAAVAEGQTIQIGGYTLTVQAGGAGSVQLFAAAITNTASGGSRESGSASVTGGAPAAQIAPAGSEGAILVNMLSSAVETEVERTAVYELEIINGGPIVASFVVQVQGLPDEWVQISPRAVNLNEGQRARVQVQINAPRAASSTAGKHPFSVAVTSLNYPGQRSITPLEFTLLPFYEFILGSPNPRQQNIPWRKHKGSVMLPVTNLSNAVTPFTVSAMDEENGCTFDFQVSDSLQLTKQATFKAPAGELVELPVEITPLKQPVIALRSRRYHYTATVQVAEQAPAPQMVSGTVVSHPLLGWWSILLTVLLVLLGVFFLVQPRITYFQVAAGKDVIELGDTTTLEWKVSPFATRLSISAVEDAIKNGQTHLTVAPAQSTTYEMVAGNWLSGLVGLDQKRTQTVLVVPPSPGISVFEVDQTRVDKGKPVTIRWSITRAEQAFLTIDEVVYELKPEEFSGEKAVVLEEDAVITLEAQSGSGNELRSYFINVVPPHIDVLSFTVWVRPGARAMNWTQPVALQPGSGPGGPRAALLPPGTASLSSFFQDTDFSEKYVELVPDTSSDTGYRVEFHQPDRELAKGEQVMLEWNVDGVETIAIAPFTEVLPNHGKQPFFPQESMNFVLTAKSGELEKLFMLPVTVFDGEPPKAPTIDIFNASPSKSIGPANVQFSWSISGEWTRVQLMAGEEIAADYLNPQGFKKIEVSETTSFILTAWNGDLSSAKILEVTIDPTLKKSTLVITDVYPHAGYFRVGDTVNVFIDFEKLPANTPDPTGEVVVSDGFSICTIKLPVKSCALTFTTPGTKQIKASYGGDDIYASTDSQVYAKERIIVDANRVNLSPAYFYTSFGAKAATIPAIASADFRVGDGLFVDVTVTSQNRTLEDDKKGQVTLRYCPLDAADKIVDNQCISAGPSTVTVSSVGGANIGHANILIANLRRTGRFALLVSYVHLDGAFEPVLIGDTAANRILFTVKQGQLVLVPQSTAPCNYKTCLLHQSASADIVFDARLLLDDLGTTDPLDDELVDLYPNFPLPGPISMVATPSGGTAMDWSGSCSWQVNGSIYQLYCTKLDLTQAVALTYNFSPADVNYTTPFPQAITIDVKKATTIEVSPTLFNNLHVGQRVELLKGAVLVKETASGSPVSGSLIYVTARDSSKDIHTMIEIVVGSNCAWATDATKGLQITQSSTPATDTCVVYFKHSGANDLLFTYNGTSTHDISSKEAAVTISKQNGLTLTWNPTFPDPLAIYTDQVEAVTVGCDTSNPSCANFSPISLAGAAIIFDMSQAVGCQVYQNNSLLADGKTNLPTTLTGGVMSLDGIRFRCTSQGTKTIRVDFIDPAYADFAFKSSGGNSVTFKVGNRPATLSSEFRIYNDTTQSTSTMIGSPTVAIPNLYVGEEYQVFVTVNSVADEDTTSTDDYIKMTWPSDLDGRLDPDSARTTCVKGSSAGEFKIPLEKKTGPTRWEASCKLSFKFATTTNLGANDKIKLELVTKDSRYSADAQEIDLPNNIVKRTVTITSSVTANASDGSGNPYARSMPKLVVTLADAHQQMDASLQYLTVTQSPGSTLTCSKVGTNIECPIPDTAVWTGSVSINYAADPNFEDEDESRSFEIVAIPVDLSAMTGSFPLVFTCLTNECRTTGWSNGDNIKYTWKGDTNAIDFTVQPLFATEMSGYVTFTISNWSPSSTCSTGITVISTGVTQSGCTYSIPINTSTNTAHFEFKFTSTDSSVNYKVGYTPGTAPFTARNGWITTNVGFRVYEQVQFVLDDHCDGSCGVKLESPVEEFTFYAEYLPCGGLEEEVFNCEGDGSCWGNHAFYVPDGGADDDEWIETEPEWDDLISEGCTYQAVIKNGEKVGIKTNK